MEHELDKLYDEWYEVILEVPVLMNQPTEKSTFLVNDVSTVRIVITFYIGEFCISKISEYWKWFRTSRGIWWYKSFWYKIFSTFSTICWEEEKLQFLLLVLKRGYSHTGLQASHVSMLSMSCAKWSTQFGLALDSRILSWPFVTTLWSHFCYRTMHSYLKRVPWRSLWSHFVEWIRK